MLDVTSIINTFVGIWMAYQWHVEYPTDKKINFFSAFALSKASWPHGYQSTGFVACCNKYGDFSKISWLVCFVSDASLDIILNVSLYKSGGDPNDPDLKTYGKIFP